MKQALLILVVLATLLAPSTFILGQETAKPPLLTFDDLKKNDGIEGQFRIEGYVLDIYKCPPCPPRAMCKPCIPDNVVITDTAEPKDLSKVNRLRVFTEKPEQFEQKKKYSFTVKLKQPFPAGQAINTVDLVSFEPLK
ncbi:MAG TPA: hypothetical protein VE969_02840 [Pyrinomonadaceae bacterium]|nr:hypothetical protein [Pyrinomonadaceae bacterium]